MSLSIYWLIGGAALLALEAFGIPGIGALFAGLAAIVTGLLIEFGALPADDLLAQGATFFLATVLFAALLWKKLKNWRLSPGGPRYRNMVGDEAIVVDALSGDFTGNVRWSGTVMQARLQHGTVAELPIGARAVITAVDGNVLIVAPKH